MKKRKGEKMGWICRWIGSFLWFCLLSIIWMVKGEVFYGIVGLGLFFLAISIIILLAPWRLPNTRYWKLMLPIFILLVFSVSVYIYLEGGFEQTGLSMWSLIYLTPILIPIINLGKRCWKDGEV